MKKHLEKLKNFELNCTQSEFICIFGSVGVHLYDKFKYKCRSNIWDLYFILDTENENKLIAYLES